jgi:predicted nucleic acid-binding protein
MKHLLDVNVLISAIWTGHVHHSTVRAWLLSGKEVVLCPVAELGFIRISAHKKFYDLPMQDVKKALRQFINEWSVQRIPDDLPAVESNASTSDDVTDVYLADLAAKHGLKLATLDQGIKHPSAELIV